MKINKFKLHTKILIVLGIFAILFYIHIFFIYGFSSSKKIIYSHWNIMIPIEMKEIYRKSDIGIDAEHYYIFQYNRKKQFLFSNFSENNNASRRDDMIVIKNIVFYVIYCKALVKKNIYFCFTI